MSNISTVKALRFANTFLSQIQVAIDSANEHRTDEPYTFNSWVMAAIQAKLDHLDRSRTKRPRLTKEIHNAIMDDETAKVDEPTIILSNPEVPQ